MIYHYPNTTVSALNKTLVAIRDGTGSSAVGRVLTLVIATEPGTAEEAILAAEGAAREHPMRVIVLSTGVSADPHDSHLDGEIRLGGDNGSSEVILLTAYGTAVRDEKALVTGLLLPDAPTWPSGRDRHPPAWHSLPWAAPRCDASPTPEPRTPRPST